VQRLTVASSTAAYNFLHNGTDSWIAAVSVYGTAANPQAAYTLFGNNGQSSGNIGCNYTYDDRTTGGFTANNALQAQTTAGSFAVTNAIRLLKTDSSGPLDAYNNIASPQAMLVQDAVWHSGDATPSRRFRLRVNGGSEIAANEVSGTPVTSNATFNLQLGSNGNNANTFEGDICELMMFSQIPTAAARDLIRRYLASKWGVALA
jgi:hypothetical protein